MSIKSIFAGLFGGKEEEMTEGAYAHLVELIGSVAANTLDLAAAVPYVKLTYGADRQAHAKAVRDVAATLIIQISGAVTVYATHSTLRVTKLAPVVPENIAAWCIEAHKNAIILLELCAAKGRDVISDEQAAKTISALNKLHDTLTNLLSE